MKKKKVKSIFIFLAILGLLVFLYFTSILSPIKKKIYEVSGPALSRFYSLGSNIGNAYRRQTDKMDLSSKMENLEKRINELTVENAKMNELSEENKKLREYLEFLDKREFSYEMAHVISKGFVSAPEENEQDIVIDKGTEDGVSLGLAVVNSEGVLVGKISRVEERISRVRLSSNSDCKIAATIQGDDRTIGVANGNLGLTINMGFIDQDEDIDEGDLVVTSGLEENIPRGLVIGKVSRIDSSSNEIWKSVVVEPQIDYDRLIMVSVILP